MTKIQMKSLEHALQLLNSVEHMKIYSAARTQLIKLEGSHFDKDNTNTALEVITEELYTQFDKVKVAKEWIEVLLSDSPK